MKLDELRDRLRKGLRLKPKASEPPKRKFDPKAFTTKFTLSREEVEALKDASEPRSGDPDLELETWFREVADKQAKGDR